MTTDDPSGQDSFDAQPADLLDELRDRRERVVDLLEGAR